MATPTAYRRRVLLPSAPVLRGARVVLRPATPADVAALSAIRSQPEVTRWWTDPSDEATIRAELDDPDVERFAIWFAGRVVGAIQWYAEPTPTYRHAGIDIFLDPPVHGRGLGSDAVRTLARHLFDAHRHHRLVIDPAAGNADAIRCYARVGFRPVGVLRRYERLPDGGFRDGLLMDLLAGELTEPA